jgi:hypothetical protein
MDKGKTIGLFGPEINFSKIIKNIIKRASHQFIKDSPFIVIVNNGRMLGNNKDNIQAIESLFQPSINTRYSAVVLLSTHDLRERNDFTKIINPYAITPIPKDISALF